MKISHEALIERRRQETAIDTVVICKVIVLTLCAENITRYLARDCYSYLCPSTIVIVLICHLGIPKLESARCFSFKNFTEGQMILPLPR